MSDKKVLIYCKDCKTIFASNPRGCPWCINKDLGTTIAELQASLKLVRGRVSKRIATVERLQADNARLTEEVTEKKKLSKKQNPVSGLNLKLCRVAGDSTAPVCKAGEKTLRRIKGEDNND